MRHEQLPGGKTNDEERPRPSRTSATVMDGTDGTDGTSCTIEEDDDGTSTLACTDGTSVLLSSGGSAGGCQVGPGNPRHAPFGVLLLMLVGWALMRRRRV